MLVGDCRGKKSGLKHISVETLNAAGKQAEVFAGILRRRCVIHLQASKRCAGGIVEAIQHFELT